MDPAPGLEEDVAFTLPLDEVYWAAVLADTDLEAREDAFDLLLERASRDPLTEAWLEGVAQSNGDLTLVWTARLALRELACEQSKPKRKRGPRFLRQPSLIMGEGLSHELAELERRLSSVLGGMGVHVVAPQATLEAGPSGARSRALSPPVSGKRRVHVEQSGEGLVIRVETRANGERSMREYSGPSMRDVLEANPELESQLGLEVFQSFGGSVPWVMRVGRGPVPAAAPPVPESVENGQVLGVHLAPVPAARVAGLGLGSGGLLVTGVQPGTIASVLGLTVGDVLVSVGGRDVSSLDDVTLGLSEASGKTLSVRWFDGHDRQREKAWSPLEPD